METVYWKQVSWKVGLVPAPRGKWLTAAVDWPDEELGRLDVDGAAKQWETSLLRSH